MNEALTNVTLNLGIDHESQVCECNSYIHVYTHACHAIGPILQDSVKPASHSILLNSIDGVEDYYNGSVMPVTTTVTGNENSVVLKVPFLPYKRVFEATVLPYTCQDHPLTNTIELSKVCMHVAIRSNLSCVDVLNVFL